MAARGGHRGGQVRVDRLQCPEFPRVAYPLGMKMTEARSKRASARRAYPLGVKIDRGSF